MTDTEIDIETTYVSNGILKPNTALYSRQGMASIIRTRQGAIINACSQYSIKTSK